MAATAGTWHGPQDSAEYKVVQRQFVYLVRLFQGNFTSLLNNAFSNSIITTAEQDELLKSSKSSEEKSTDFLKRILFKIQYTRSSFQDLINLLRNCDLAEVAERLEVDVEQEGQNVPSQTSSMYPQQRKTSRPSGGWPRVPIPELSSKPQEYPASSQQDGVEILSDNSSRIMGNSFTPQQISQRLTNRQYQENVLPGLNGVPPSRLSHSSMVNGSLQSKPFSTERDIMLPSGTYFGNDASYADSQKLKAMMSFIVHHQDPALLSLLR